MQNRLRWHYNCKFFLSNCISYKLNVQIHTNSSYYCFAIFFFCVLYGLKFFICKCVLKTENKYQLNSKTKLKYSELINSSKNKQIKNTFHLISISKSFFCIVVVVVVFQKIFLNSPIVL